MELYSRGDDRQVKCARFGGRPLVDTTHPTHRLLFIVVAGGETVPTTWFVAGDGNQYEPLSDLDNGSKEMGTLHSNGSAMPVRKREPDHTVWAMLFMAPESERAVRLFLSDTLRVPSRRIHSRLHLTVYHARRRLDGLVGEEGEVDVPVPAADWRFMTMTPGGENPRAGIVPSAANVGVRLRRSSDAYKTVLDLRSRFYVFESPRVLGARSPSAERKNAFGARHFQPHVTLLRPGSGIDNDLHKIGDLFRASLPPLLFNRLVVRCRNRSNRLPPAITKPFGQ